MLVLLILLLLLASPLVSLLGATKQSPYSPPVLVGLVGRLVPVWAHPA